MQGMGNDLRLSKLHREEIGRQVRALRAPGRPRGGRGIGPLLAFFRELRVDLVRLAWTLGPPRAGRKRKGAV